MAKGAPQRDSLKPRSTALGLEINLHRRDGLEVATYSDDEGPPERQQHGKIRTVRVYNGDNIPPECKWGTRNRVQRSIDLMGQMQAKGTITSAYARAGRRFGMDFDIARLHGLKAASMERVTGVNGGGDLSGAAIDARDRVWRALEAVGGHTSPAGRIVWAVLGERHSLREWAEQNGSGIHGDRKTNRGILIASLGVLAALYDFC